MTWRRWAALSSFALAASLVPRPAAAQLAPTGGHYAARASDTGYAGAVNSSGGYGASVPLDLPAARGGLPIPLQIVYGERGVGAAGLGWDVPLSYIRRDNTFAHRRPVGTPDVDPQAREQVLLVLNGQRLNLVQTASGWVAQRDAPDLDIREQGDGTWVVYDGQGRTYLFAVAAPALAGAGIWHLASITGPGGNNVSLTYAAGNPSVPGAPDAISLDLSTIQYNPDSSGCYKNMISLGYDGPATTPSMITPLGTKILARVHSLLTVAASSRAICGGSAETLRTYQLQYAPDADTGLPRLISVQMTGRRGTPEFTTPLPVASYSYGSASFGGQLTYQNMPDISVVGPQAYPPAETRVDLVTDPTFKQAFSTAHSVIDFTGDGRSDLFVDFSIFGSGLQRNAPNGASIQFVAASSPPSRTVELLAGLLPRYGTDPQNPGLQEDIVLQEAIDINGDGRIDLVHADPGSWTIALNTPDPANAQETVWQVRTISTVALAQHLQELGLWSGDSDVLPLASRSTRGENVYSACVQWRGATQRWEEYTDAMDCQPGGSLVGSGGPEVTITNWELKDINGDGYPDVVFNSSPVTTVSHVNTNFPPPPQGDGVIIRSSRTLSVELAAGEANEIDAVFNIVGVHIAGSANPFSAPVTIRSNAGCGVSRWAELDSTHQQLVCSIIDVNGDGIADLVNGTSVFLGTGSRGPGAFFTPGALLTLPGALAIQSNSQKSSCARPATDTTTFPVFQVALLRDLTGDGIPDYVVSDINGHYTVFVGSGTGFTAPPLQVSGVSSLSGEIEDCGGRDFRTELGLFDLDGDGKADVVWSTPTNPNTMSWARLVGSSGVQGAPDAGRLVQLDNGYGALTHVSYRSAKEDPTTLHQVPFPEIVVSAVQTTATRSSGGDLAETQYAYGGADLVFDPALDTFTFPGYRRRVELRIPIGQTQGIATITDTLGPATRADPDGLVPPGGGCCGASTTQQRYDLYLRAGRTSDVTVLSGSLGTDVWALLSTNITSDGRRIAATHYEWSTRLLAAASDPAGPEVCSEMVLPYDYSASSSYALSNGTYDVCTAHGFAFASSVQSWRGAPGAAPPSDANVATRSDVQTVDNFGRVLRVAQANDVNRDDDDVCVDTTYAAPVGTNERVLFAAATRRVSNCDAVTYTAESWEYDKLAVGSVSAGFPTAHTVERHDELGVLLGTVREFDSTYDAVGNPLIVTSTRDGDGATRTTVLEYDSFGLVPTTITIGATGVPAMQVITTRDPVTLNVLSRTDANGTQYGTTFDGFGRPVLSTVTPPGGTQGVLSWVRYFGFEPGATERRAVARKVFTDPIVPATVRAANSATGRTTTISLDELGRVLIAEVALGKDYDIHGLSVRERRYDSLGRILFETDTFSSGSEQFDQAYGSAHYYNADGTPSCVVRGNGPQPFTMTTDEVHEIYPTCFERTFQNNTEVVSVRDPASLLPGSPQDGVVQSSYSTAIGRLLARSTQQGNTRLEYATFAYDRLGHQTGMTRYLDPTAMTKPVTSSWHFDSLGQVLELDEPDSAPQFNTYSNWGELLTTHREVDASNTLDVASTYDALGRIIHREQRHSGDLDPATVNDYLYDEPVNVSPQVTPTNLVGRLAQAISPTGAVSFSYDNLGQVNARVFTDNQGGMYVESHTYHADGTPAALDFFLPDTGYADEHVDYSFDSAGRGRSVHYTSGASSEDLFEASTIDPLGRVRVAQYGAVSYAAAYADTGRRLPKSVNVSSALGSRAITFPAFDPIGGERSRNEVKDGSGSQTTSWSYDALGRLSSAVKISDGATALNQQFAYDPLGNLLGIANGMGAPDAINTTLSYLATDRDRICHVAYGGDTGTACNVTYDEVGNITQQATRTGTRQLSYFADGSVRSITDGSTEAQFRYDAFGAVQTLDVTSTSSPDTRHDRRYGGLIAWRDETTGSSTASVLTRTIPGPSGFVATRHGANGSWVFEFGEARGNRFFTDETGAFVQDVDYSPYGELTSTGAQPGSSRYTNWQWNGGDALAALGVSHLGARIYDPVIGRFLSRDPLLIPRTAATTNPYAFAMNDPVNGSDPSGLDPEDQRIPVFDFPFDSIFGITGGDGIPTPDPDTNQAGLSGTGVTYVGSGPDASIGTSGYPASGAGSLGSGGGLSSAGPYPVYPGWFKGVGVYDRLLNYTVDGLTDSLSDAWANTTNGVSDHVGATHPGHATVVGDVRPDIQTAVGVGVNIAVQLLLAVIFSPGEIPPEDQIFVRRGTGYETATRLERQASAAEKAGKAQNGVPYGHGVSVTSPESNVRFSSNPSDAVSATRGELERAGFDVRHTPTRSDSMHHTVQLPTPVSPEVADIFNKVFGRSRR